MSETMTQAVNVTGYSPVHGAKDGFEEQKILLSRISRELDEYFSLRAISRLD